MTIITDGTCPFCVRCADWLIAQQPAIALRVVPSTDPVVQAALGHLPGYGRELLVVADTGQVWSGPDAFIATLWCLSAYRSLASGLSGKTAGALARRFFVAVSANRDRLGSAPGAGACTDATCGV